MYDLLCKFENIITLRTIMDCVDRDYLQMGDLEEIIGYADELDIDLNCLDYGDDRLIHEVFDEWYEDLNTMYLNIKNGLLKLI